MPGMDNLIGFIDFSELYPFEILVAFFNGVSRNVDAAQVELIHKSVYLEALDGDDV